MLKEVNPKNCYHRIYIASCPVDCTSHDSLVDKLCRTISHGEQAQVLGVNAAFVVNANRDTSYQKILESTTYLPADGFWVSVAAKVLGFPGVGHVDIERLCYGLLGRLSESNKTIYLLGGLEQVVQKAAKAIEEHYPGIKVVGRRNGYFTEAEEEEILFEINRVHPDLILVGMTSPKKEIWMSKYRDRVQVCLIIGVGGLFDVFAGQVPPAPKWVKVHGLEWLFRLVHDPKRLWKRYIFGNAQFCWLVVRDWVKGGLG